MIGEFRFASSPASQAIAIRMVWVDDEPMATIHLPDSVLRLAEELDLMILQDTEPLRLPVLLGYGVSVAALTGHVLRLTGDESAWQREWGPLQHVN